MNEDGNRLDAFLRALGELSRQHGFAVGDGATVWVMDDDDFTRRYSTDEESQLTFA